MPVHIISEWRLLKLVTAIIAAYAVVVVWISYQHGQMALVKNYEVGDTIAAIWIVGLAFAFIAYALDLLIRRRPLRPLKVMIDEVKAQIFRLEWLVARAGILCGFTGMMVLFQPMKVMIGHVRGFPLDHAIAAIDKIIFFGVDPWRITHSIIGDYGTFVLHMAYSLWFVMMWMSLVYLMVRPELLTLRARYLVAFLLCWIFVGSAAAWLLASAGPCFFERAFGDPYFAPLMAQLQTTDVHLRSAGLGIWGLELQDMLWNAYADKQRIFGGGISAMPSVHVSIAVLMALGGRFISRKAGYALGLFAFIIWIGSIHLGWHYALDGIVAAVMTLGIWWFSGWLVERFVFREAPAASLRPALAE